jgi:hypothetical protein
VSPLFEWDGFRLGARAELAAAYPAAAYPSAAGRIADLTRR